MEHAQPDFDYPLVPGSVKGAMREAEAKSRDLWQVDPAHIRLIPGFNVRVKNEAYFAHVASIKQSMLSEGFKQHKPLAGYVAKEGDTNVIYVYDGHCRFEAAQGAIAEGADILHIPVVVTASGTNLEDLTVDLVRSNSGLELSPYEKALVCKRLASFGWENAEIARRLGFTGQYVSDLLLLIGAPKVVRDMVSEGTVSAATAIDTLKKHGTKASDMLVSAATVAAESGKTKVTKKHVAPVSSYLKQAKKQAPALADALTRVKADGAYRLLHIEVCTLIDKLVGALDELRTDNDEL